MPVGKRLLAFLFPPRCPLCRAAMRYGEEFCPACRGRIDWLCSPVRRSLGRSPGFRCFAPFRYEGEIRERLIEMKNREKRINSRLFAPYVAEMVRRWALSGARPVVVYVPGFEPEGRVYNAARVLARAVARRLELPLLPDALLLLRPKRRQHELSAANRQRNVAGIFFPGSEPVKGMRVLLVDDIVTTGATLCSCAEALLAAGAKEVLCAAAASSKLERP